MVIVIIVALFKSTADIRRHAQTSLRTTCPQADALHLVRCKNAFRPLPPNRQLFYPNSAYRKYINQRVGQFSAATLGYFSVTIYSNKPLSRSDSFLCPGKVARAKMSVSVCVRLRLINLGRPVPLNPLTLFSPDNIWLSFWQLL